MRFISFDDLRDKGINFSRSYLCRLQKAGKFPKSVKIGAARIGWVEAEIDQWMADCIKQRDDGTPPMA